MSNHDEFIKKQIDEVTKGIGSGDINIEDMIGGTTMAMSKFEAGVRYLTEAIDGFKESHKQLFDMEKKLYLHYLAMDFDVRSCIGEFNLGILTDILTETELNEDKEDLLLTLVVRYADNVIYDVPNGQDVWEAASAYDFTNVFLTMQNNLALVSKEDLGMFMWDNAPRSFMIFPLRDDIELDVYRATIDNGQMTLQELLITVYILDNIGIPVGENTAAILLKLVNDENFYMVSDHPLIESIKGFAILTLKGEVETDDEEDECDYTLNDLIKHLDDECLK